MCQARPRSPCQAARQPDFLHRRRGGALPPERCSGHRQPTVVGTKPQPATTNHHIPASTSTLRPIWHPKCAAHLRLGTPLDITSAPKLTSTPGIVSAGMQRPKAADQLWAFGSPEKEGGKRRRKKETATQSPLTRDRSSDPPAHPFGYLDPP